MPPSNRDKSPNLHSGQTARSYNSKKSRIVLLVILIFMIAANILFHMKFQSQYAAVPCVCCLHLLSWLPSFYFSSCICSYATNMSLGTKSSKFIYVIVDQFLVLIAHFGKAFPFPEHVDKWVSWTTGFVSCCGCYCHWRWCCCGRASLCSLG